MPLILNLEDAKTKEFSIVLKKMVFLLIFKIIGTLFAQLSRIKYIRILSKMQLKFEK
jgi:hypothetical protein